MKNPIAPKKVPRLTQSVFNASPVEGSTQAKIAEVSQSFKDGGSPFAGPVVDQDGEVVWAEGSQPSYEEVESMDFFVEGVVGKID